jgi:hypothetical protein
MKRIIIEGIAYECSASIIKEKKEYFLKLATTPFRQDLSPLISELEKIETL